MNGYRSNFEKQVGNNLELRETEFEYETEQFKYEVLQTKKYTPDFILNKKDGSRIYIEAKGYLSLSDRNKMKFVKKNYPHMDIRLLFQKANNKLSAKAKQTYAQWADQYGFPWAEGNIPQKWLEE
jgi:hypothetical protein